MLVRLFTFVNLLLLLLLLVVVDAPVSSAYIQKWGTMALLKFKSIKQDNSIYF